MWTEGQELSYKSCASSSDRQIPNMGGVDNAPVTPLGLRVSMNDGDHLLSDGSPIHFLPLICYKNRSTYQFVLGHRNELTARFSGKSYTVIPTLPVAEFDNTTLSDMPAERRHVQTYLTANFLRKDEIIFLKFLTTEIAPLIKDMNVKETLFAHLTCKHGGA
ncbi:hypothetical protein EVAR_101067_1 [Eumeta japonica]|uniref:Uncharacterized protein n=1 Tax=Eumeta variegata TaxID=151549 RepID=A0A4C1SKD0_EUMVA|nr:hypothetical protein EVAR_101067_1 [Eumeta japonica]